MDNFSNNEESQFFDAQERIIQEPDFVHDYMNKDYDVWTSAPQSVSERRRKLIRRMGLDLCELERETSVETCGDNIKDIFFDIGDNHRIIENSGAILRMSEDKFSLSSWSTDDLDLSGFRNGNSNSNCASECTINGIVEEGRLRNFPRLSPRVDNFVPMKMEDDVKKPSTVKKSKKNKWLSKLRSMTCMVVSEDVKDGNVGRSSVSRIRRVRVRHSRKSSREISALFTGQDIKAHEGAIMAMKFSPDGQYLASAGEDKIIRIWQVVEDERDIDIRDLDPSCVYFSANHLSELGPLTVEKDELNKWESSSVGRTQDSACVIFPPKVFRILENPLHVFEGHNGEILDLSWSNNNCLLSSSVDKTVRLWRVGADECMKILQHSDHVGSIDGKVRIWAISESKVVDWTEITDIITAVSYRPDGQSGVIGSITGTCRFFDLSDNHLQLGAQMCLTSKKKSPCKRITAFQFFPQDPCKILVTCADSKVRIIDGMNVIGKYKSVRLSRVVSEPLLVVDSGLGNTGNQISATFTSNGKHIISASDDSNIYIWNHTDNPQLSLSKPKAIRSFECFSSDASIALPWAGLKNVGSTNSPPFSPSDYFSQLSQEYFLDSIYKGSATWPEEKLPIHRPQTIKSKSTLSKSQYKLFKNSCRSSYGSHAWGLVIVTAGSDGRIRSFHNYGLPIP
ncbi:hypothetical protein OROGR_025852 [Orobanche gracilis]